MIGQSTVDHEGILLPSVERAVQQLIILAKQQNLEIVELKKQLQGFANKRDELQKELTELKKQLKKG
jgi:cell division septum initiation protein DivIVA